MTREEQILKQKIDELSQHNGSYPSFKHMDTELKDAIIEAMQEYANEHPNYTPFQTCPICQGAGKTLDIGATSAILSPCTVCSGNKIIPMHHIK